MSSLRLSLLQAQARLRYMDRRGWRPHRLNAPNHGSSFFRIDARTASTSPRNNGVYRDTGRRPPSRTTAKGRAVSLCFAVLYPFAPFLRLLFQYDLLLRPLAKRLRLRVPEDCPLQLQFHHYRTVVPSRLQQDNSSKRLTTTLRLGRFDSKARIEHLKIPRASTMPISFPIIQSESRDHMLS